MRGEKRRGRRRCFKWKRREEEGEEQGCLGRLSLLSKERHPT
jgi:hypothetical protein